MQQSAYTVLLIDPDDAFRFAGANHLSQFGSLRVLSANASLPTLEEAAAAERPDVVVLAFDSQDARCVEFLARSDRPPVVAVIREGRSAEAKDAVRLGADEFVFEEPEGKHFELLAALIERAANRKRPNESLLRREQIERQIIFDSAPAMIWFKDRNNRIIRANRRAAASIGLTVEEIEGKSTYDLYPHEAAKYHRDDLDVVESGVPKLGIVERYDSPDGADIWMRVDKVPFRNEHGEVDGVIVFAIDVTEQKKAEEERLIIKRKLLEAQKLESLGVLAGGVAHDFNNLLTGVLGNASLAKLDVPVDGLAFQYIDQIEQAALRAADLCRQMLAYSGKGHFIVQRLSLNAMIVEMRQLLDLSIAKKSTLRLQLSADLPQVLGDASQLRQVVVNLVMNASDAIGDKAGIITVATRLMNVNVDDLDRMHRSPDFHSGAHVALEVHDDGTGMDEATLARIFDPFFSTKFAGRGLGLAAVHGIMRGHKGAIDVITRPGAGTVFRLLFPKAEGRDQSQAAGAAAPKWRGQGLALLVDDERMVRATASRMLESFGFEVLLAENGAVAIQELRKQNRPVAIVVLDLTMPQMDGESTFRELQRLQPGVPVVLMSGYHDNDAATRFGGAPNLRFIQKPFTADELRRSIQASLPAP